jgi:pimeloyl-ACP methyl ester carboxylesterase
MSFGAGDSPRRTWPDSPDRMGRCVRTDRFTASLIGDLAAVRRAVDDHGVSVFGRGDGAVRAAAVVVGDWRRHVSTLVIVSASPDGKFGMLVNLAVLAAVSV